MKKNLLVIFLLFISFPLLSQIKNEDKPHEGIWDFKPEKIWETDKAGNKEFGRIAELLVSRQGNIYVRDFDQNISYIFNNNGQHLGSFAKQGDAKEDVSRYLNRFLADNKIVLGTPETLQFYSEEGDFVASYENNVFMRFPLVFLNEYEFIYAPTLPQSPVNQKILMLYNLHTSEDKLVLDFSPDSKNAEPSKPAPMIMIFGLTPQVRLAMDKEKICFGRSDQYTLYISDLQGNIDLSFSLERKQKDVSPEEKKNHFHGSKIPEDRIDSLVEQLPDKMTYFSQITIMEDKIYVYAVDNIERTQRQQTIDIFSEKGKYLYKGILEFGENFTFGSPSNLVISDNFIFVILESSEGHQTLAKFKIAHPEI